MRPFLTVQDDDDDDDHSGPSPADPKAVESLLVKEMSQLTVEEREKIREEIHGAKSLAPEESPQMVEQNLHAMQEEIDLIPVKKAYNQALDLYRQQQELQLYDNGRKCYVNDRDLRIRLLRSELWDPKLAARRFVKYLDMLLIYFGPEALMRPLRFSDLCKESRQILRKGNWQVLPSRDSTGRIVLCHQGWISLPTAHLRVKVIMYMMNAVSEDIESQKKGCVVLMTANENAGKDISRAQTREHFNAMEGYPIRASAVHFCFPNTPIARMIRAGILLSGPSDERRRMQIHLEDLYLPETQYQLMTYGIPVQEIPCTSSGIIKTKYHSQWIKSRIALDEMRESGAQIDAVTHPGNNDVLFSQGGSKSRHYGNVNFRYVLDNYMDEYQSAGKDWDRLKAIREKVIHQVEADGGRFLTLDKKMSWWIPISDPVDLAERITSSFYYQAKKLNVTHGSSQVVSKSGSILFLEGNKRRKLEGEQVCCGGGW